MTIETANIILSLVIAIVISTVLVALSIHFRWFGLFWADAFVAGAVAFLVILAYAPAQELPAWLRFAYWLCVYSWLRWFVYRFVPQLPPPTTATYEDEAGSAEDIAAYFDFEEVIG
jgi:hypothetical protein